jgi:hypothetical protein
MPPVGNVVTTPKATPLMTSRSSPFHEHTPHSPFYIPHPTIRTPQFTIHNPQSTIHNPQFTVYSSQFTVHSSQFKLHSTQYTVHSSHCMLTTDYTLCSPFSTLHSTLRTAHLQFAVRPTKPVQTLRQTDMQRHTTNRHTASSHSTLDGGEWKLPSRYCTERGETIQTATHTLGRPSLGDTKKSGKEEGWSISGTHQKRRAGGPARGALLHEGRENFSLSICVLGLQTTNPTSGVAG